jgi:hypothetical protein
MGIFDTLKTVTQIAGSVPDYKTLCRKSDNTCTTEQLIKFYISSNPDDGVTKFSKMIKGKPFILEMYSKIRGQESFVGIRTKYNNQEAFVVAKIDILGANEVQFTYSLNEKTWIKAQDEECAKIFRDLLGVGINITEQYDHKQGYFAERRQKTINECLARLKLLIDSQSHSKTPLSDAYRQLYPSR